VAIWQTRTEQFCRLSIRSSNPGIIDAERFVEPLPSSRLAMLESHRLDTACCVLRRRVMAGRAPVPSRVGAARYGQGLWRSSPHRTAAVSVPLMIERIWRTGDAAIGLHT